MFKKEKNETKLNWKFEGNPTQSDLDIMKFHEDSEQASENLTVHQEISLEALKNSTIQMLLRVDTFFSEAMTEKIINKIKQQRNFSIVETKGRDNKSTNTQGVSRFVEIPSNGQDDIKSKSVIGGLKNTTNTVKAPSS